MVNLNRKILALVLTLSILISAAGVVSSRSINTYYPHSTENTNLSQNASWQMRPAVWGDLVVWEDYRDDPYGSYASPGNRNSNIYLFNMTSEEILRLTQDDSSQVNPDIWENYVVWEDYRNGNPDIYMLDLEDPAMEEFRVTDNQGSQKRPRIHGGNIVWEDYRYREDDFSDVYMYNIQTGVESRVSSERVPQIAPEIYENKIVWTDYRNFWYGAYDELAADIYMYDIDEEVEMAVVEGENNQNRPSIYRDTVVWTEQFDGSNNICMKILGEEKKVISAEASSEESPNIYGGRVVFFERYYEDSVHLHGSIYLYDIVEDTKHLLAQVDLEESYPPGVPYARNPVIHRNNIVWEERHPSEHPLLDKGQYDIYHTSVDNEAPEIIWSTLESHTGEIGIELNVSLVEGAHVTVSSEIFDKDGDLKRAYVSCEDLGIEELEMERENYTLFSVNITVEEKGAFQITVFAEDQAGNQATFYGLTLTVQSPLPEITFAGVGTSMEDLDNEVHFVLEEGNVLYFAAEVDKEVQSVRLVIEDYLPGGAVMDHRDGTYVLSVPFQDTMSTGNKTAYIEVIDQDERTIRSSDLIIRAVEPDDGEKPSTGVLGDSLSLILYLALVIFAVIFAFALIIRKFKPELWKK